MKQLIGDIVATVVLGLVIAMVCSAAAGLVAR